jgi:hypothetical protein
VHILNLTFHIMKALRNELLLTFMMGIVDGRFTPNIKNTHRRPP